MLRVSTVAAILWFLPAVAFSYNWKEDEKFYCRPVLFMIMLSDSP